MKYFHIAVTIEENGLYYSYVLRVSESDNLLSRLEIKGIVTATLCPTKKAAAELVTVWNDGYKRDNKYMFSFPAF